MPVNPLESLRTLLRVQTPQHITQDPYMAKRRAAILGGEEDMVPSADSAGTKATQIALGQQNIGVSREAIQDDEMAQLRQTLGIGRIKHEQELERAEVAPRVAGEFNLQERELVNRGALDVEKSRQTGARDLQQDYYDYLGDAGIDPTRITRGGVSVSTGAGTNAQRVPTSAQTGVLSKARGTYQGGGLNALRSMVGMERSGREDYLNALNDVLVRTGSFEWISQMAEGAQAEGLTGAAAIAEAAAQGVQLDPYEQEYLKLVLGE